MTASSSALTSINRNWAGRLIETDRLDEPPRHIPDYPFHSLSILSTCMRRSFCLWMVLGAALLPGCGSRDTIWVTGVLQKGGQSYEPPAGRKLALYFYPMTDGASSDPSGDVEMADYNSKDGSFTVPGREGHGIRPGKYRIVVVESLRRETRDELKKSAKPKRGQQRIDNDTNFLDSTFGEKTSPFVRDLRSSTNLMLDMASPTG